MNLIWTTRGRTWGHRFLRSGGSHDPLVDRDRAFQGNEDQTEVCHHRGETLALRFKDPEGRHDEAGRPIVHEIVAKGRDVKNVRSLQEGIAAYWPQLADEYAQVWNSELPPSMRP